MLVDVEIWSGLEICCGSLLARALHVFCMQHVKISAECCSLHLSVVKSLCFVLEAQRDCQLSIYFLLKETLQTNFHGRSQGMNVCQTRRRYSNLMKSLILPVQLQRLGIHHKCQTLCALCGIGIRQCKKSSKNNTKRRSKSLLCPHHSSRESPNLSCLQQRVLLTTVGSSFKHSLVALISDCQIVNRYNGSSATR